MNNKSSNEKLKESRTQNNKHKNGKISKKTLAAMLCCALLLGSTGVSVYARTAEKSEETAKGEGTEAGISGKENVEAKSAESTQSKETADTKSTESTQSKETADTKSAESTQGKETADTKSAESTQGKETADTKSAESTQGKETADTKSTETMQEKETVKMARTETTDAELVKNETVYVLAGADGSVEKIIVSDWIKNGTASDSVADRSELAEIENIKGGEKYTMNGENMRVWDAQGNDIYYQGSIEKELPVDLKVSYKLDGKNISSSELAGKCGRVTIRFDYRNRQSELVEIDGKKERIYVPYTMMTGLMLDNDIFTNVEVSNGKLINDGERTIVVGIAFPGLQENLKTDQEKLELPDYVEITADVENFEMSNAVTIAANEIFNRLKTENFDSLDDLKDSLDELTDAMDQLLNGSSQLYDGLCTLLEKSEELMKGIDQLAEGAEKLKKGAADLDQGAGEIAEGAQALADGLGQLTANSGTLNAGAGQVFSSLLGMANTQLAAAGLNVPALTIENYGEVLDGAIASLNPANVGSQAQAAAQQKVTEAVYAQKDTVAAGVTAAVRDQVAAQVTAMVRENVEIQVLESQGMTKEIYEAGIAAGDITPEQQAQTEAAIDMQMQSEEVKAIIDANTEQQMQTQEIQDMIAVKTEEQLRLLIDQNLNSSEVQGQINGAVEQAQSGTASLQALKGQLDSYQAFYNGLNQYTAGVASAKSGADNLNAGAAQLKAGATELSAGAGQLYDGIITLKNGAPALVDGVTKLRDGSMELSEGLKEFNEQGIQKFVEAVDGDVNGLLTRIRATVDVSRNYNTFSGLAEDMEGQVKFIYRTDSVKAE